MEKLTKIVLLTSLVACFYQGLSAQESNQQLKFSGQIIDTEHRPDKNLLIQYTKDDGFSAPGRGQQFFVSPEVDSLGNFQFQLPDLGKAYKIGMVLRSGRLNKLWDQKYYVESGDDVHLTIVLNKKPNEVNFTGHGAEKFNIVEAVSNQFYASYYKELSALKLTGPKNGMKDSSELASCLNKFAEMLHQYLAQKRQLIQSSGISAEMKALIQYEFADYSREWSFRTELLLKEQPEFRGMIARWYLSGRNEFFDQPTELMAKCPVYLINLLSSMTLELNLERQDKISLTRLYQTIQTNFAPAMRDRLIGYLLLYPYFLNETAPVSTAERDALYRDASQTIQISYVKQAILAKISEFSHKSAGQMVYPAEFQKIDGSTFQLESLKGKVVLIDLWFLGCVGCADFHRQFEQEIYPKYKTNEHFVFLSLNVNKKIADWKTGLESGKYTSPNYLNVGTLSGIEHPFLKFYNVKGAPFLLLVGADGKVQFLPEGVQSIPDLISRIDQALVGVARPQ